MTPSFRRITFDFNVMPLQAALHAKPHLFGQRKERTHQGPHAQTTDIWVRFNDIKNLDPANPAAFVAPHESVWYPAADELPEVRPLVFDLMRLVEGNRLGGVLISKTPPGCRIAPHTDAGWHAQYYSKFYIPIQADPGATFEWEDGVIRPELGEVYWFRNDRTHWCENESARDRISLIVCIQTDLYPVTE